MDDYEDTYATDFNLPGDSSGETNGLYAGMTSNPNGGDFGSYFEDNSGDPIIDASTASAAIQAIQGINSSNNARATSAQLAANQQQLALAKVSKPSILAQWSALGLFGQVAALASIVALIVFVRRGA